MKQSLRVVIPLDSTEGPCYIEPVCDRERDNDVDCSYRMSAQRRGWVKTMEDRRISQGDGESCTSDSDEEDERWRNRLTTLHCNIVTKSLYCVRAQDRELPKYDGLTIIDEFMIKFEITVPEHQWFDAMRWALCATPVRWWGTHEGTFEDWHTYKHMVKIRFGKLELRITEKYDGHDDPRIHLTRWIKAYREEPQPEWVHLFYHTLDVIRRN